MGALRVDCSKPQMESTPELQQVARIAECSAFRRSPRLGRFLRFVVEEAQAGRSSEIKESRIGVEVFLRPADYNPKIDPIVRIEAAKLRSRLTEYYAGEGRDEPILIEIPKGGYVPFMTTRAPAAPVRRGVPRMTVLVALGVCALAAVLTANLSRQNDPNRPVIAVLPFENGGSSDADDYLSTALADELIRSLSHVPGIETRSRNSTPALGKSNLTVRQIGARLKASFLLKGKFIRSPASLRVRATLFRTSDENQVWSAAFERSVGEQASLQSEIVRGITAILREPPPTARSTGTSSSAAYDLYLRGRFYVERLDPNSLHAALSHFQRAVVIDPSFARAWTGIADAYKMMSFANQMPSEQAEPLIREAALKALALDPSLPDAYLPLAVLDARENDWGASERKFRRARELDPNSSRIRRDYAMSLLLRMGRMEEAVRETRRALELDPESLGARTDFAGACMLAGRYDEAIDAAGIVLASDPAYPLAGQYLGRAYLHKGMYREAEPHLKAGWLGYMWAISGAPEKARALYTQMARSPGASQLSLHLAVIQAGLGEKQEAVETLERAARNRPANFAMYFFYPEFRSLRELPRFRHLRQSLGLP